MNNLNNYQHKALKHQNNTNPVHKKTQKSQEKSVYPLWKRSSATLFLLPSCLISSKNFNGSMDLPCHRILPQIYQHDDQLYGFFFFTHYLNHSTTNISKTPNFSLGRHKSQFESTRFELKFNQRPNLATKFQQEVTKSLST